MKENEKPEVIGEPDQKDVKVIDWREATTENFSFDFDEDGHHFYVTCMHWTGKEQVFMDDKMVSKRYNFGFSSKHSFFGDDTQYEIEVLVDDLLLSQIQCVLIKNGVHLKTKTIKMAGHKEAKNGLKSLIRESIIAALIGVTLAFAGRALLDFLGWT